MVNYTGTCAIPKLPDHAQLDYVPKKTGIYQVLTISCLNTSLVAVRGTNLICKEDGIWDGEELECRG